MKKSEALFLMSGPHNIPEELYDEEENNLSNIEFLSKTDVTNFSTYEELLDAKIEYLENLLSL